jgi:predicted NAD/FAD-binding protein
MSEQTRMKIAIIGGGISGMASAYLLHKTHDVTVFEKNAYIGGHSRTINIKTPDGMTPVDTGFIVYNERNYPHLTALFRHLGVKTVKSDMSFGVSIANGWLEYGSKGPFAQKKNLLRPGYLRMLADVLRFNAGAVKMAQNSDMSLGQLLDRMHMGRWFRDYYLLAMGAAIWSCPLQSMLDFPASTFVRFFENHGLLTINNHPQWYTVDSGSVQYIEKLTKSFADRVRLNSPVKKVIRFDNRVDVITDQDTTSFDRVIFAGHTDDTLSILSDADDQERMILKSIPYQKNKIVVHGDDSFMPKAKGAWASWVYLSEGLQDQSATVSLTYWMNNLQPLRTSSLVFVTLNPGRMPRADLIYDQHHFDHPVFNLDAQQAQNLLPQIQGKRRSYFCGAWTRYGFHEDGFLSAVKVAQAMGINPPWL